MSEHPEQPDGGDDQGISGAPESVPFTVPSEYEAALDRVIGLAERELLIFDRDLKPGGWNGIARNATLRDFLLGHRDAHLQVVVHDTAYIEGHLARLTTLLRDFAYKVSILRTVDDARNVTEGMVIADARHAVHRYHLDYFRGEMTLNAPLKAGALRDRFQAILGYTEPGVNATLLGL